MKSKIVKKFLVCRLSPTNKYESDWSYREREYKELLELEDFDTEEKAIQYIEELDDWADMTILTVYYRNPDYD